MEKIKGRVESKMTDLPLGRIIFALARIENLDKLGVWDWQTHTTTGKINKQQGSIVYRREIYSIPCNKKKRKKIWKNKSLDGKMEGHQFPRREGGRDRVL